MCACTAGSTKVSNLYKKKLKQLISKNAIYITISVSAKFVAVLFSSLQPSPVTEINA